MAVSRVSKRDSCIRIIWSCLVARKCVYVGDRSFGSFNGKSMKEKMKALNNSCSSLWPVAECISTVDWVLLWTDMNLDAMRSGSRHRWGLLSIHLTKGTHTRISLSLSLGDTCTKTDLNCLASYCNGGSCTLNMWIVQGNNVQLTLRTVVAFATRLPPFCRGRCG